MGKTTEISWTDHTHNIVWGCTKVSDACKFCYAETWAKRTGWNIWGQNATRRIFGDKHWREPLKWNATAEKEGRRHRVFCSSMADVFEDHPTVEQERRKLWPLIEQTPWLDWQLLTKRPENIAVMIPPAWHGPGMPVNVWLGVTAESQEMADKRIPILCDVPAVVSVRFVSAEPLLAPLDLTKYMRPSGRHDDSSECHLWYDGCNCPRVSWVIVGGESGPHARPFSLDWARMLLAQCRETGASPFIKQLGDDPREGGGFDGLGNWRHAYIYGLPSREATVVLRLKPKGGDQAEFPADLVAREFPEARP